MKENKEIVKKPTKKWLKPLLLGLLVLVIGGGLLIYKSDQDAKARREVFLEQQQKMISFWQDQGLTEEEIQTKLSENMAENFNYQPSLLQSLLRTFRHATGSGPGGSGTRGTFPPPEGGRGDGSVMGRTMERR